MGSWIDFTGAGEGRSLAEVKLYSDWYLAPANPLTKVLAGESPVTLRPQFGAFDNVGSSLTFKAPTRTSLYLYDESPLEGRYTRITGADQSRIQIQALGTWMNDKPSGMVLVNHGSVSSSLGSAVLAEKFKTATDGIDRSTLTSFMMSTNNAVGSLTWQTTPVTVTSLPGERLLQFSRNAWVDLQYCQTGGTYTSCKAVGTVIFTVLVRPYVTLVQDYSNPSLVRPTVKFEFVEGVATSVGCTGSHCDERNDSLDVLFTRSIIQNLFTDALDATLDSQVVAPINVPCDGLGVRRVNVLPGKLEIVMGDTTEQATCAIRSQSSSLFDATRLSAQITNHNADGSPALQFNGIYNVVPDASMVVPPAVY